MKTTLSKLFFLAIFLATLSQAAEAQVTLLSPTGDGGFETSSAFAGNGWSQAQPGNPRQWQVGTAGGVSLGARAAYIGNAATYNGSNVASVQHFYRDLVIPPGATLAQLSFYLKETVVDNTFDYFDVYITTPVNTPVANVDPFGSFGYINVYENTATVYSGYTLLPTINLSNFAGTTIRLVFSFISDGATPHARPAIDRVNVVYTAGSACSGTPTAGTAAALANPICRGGWTLLYTTGTSAVSGVTYQWESSPDNLNWSNVSGATSGAYFANPITTTYYRRKITCTSSSGTSTSSAILLNVTDPTPIISSTPASLCFTGSTSVALSATGATSYSWAGPGLSATTGSSVTGTLPGFGQYSYLVTGTSGACVVTSNFTYNAQKVPGAPVVTPLMPTDICLGNSSTLTALAASTTDTLLKENFETLANIKFFVQSNYPTGAWGQYSSPSTMGGIPGFTTESVSSGSSFAGADADDEYWNGSGFQLVTATLTPVLDASSYSALSLVFRQYLRYNAGDIARVEVSTNGGSTWTSVQAYTSTQGVRNIFTTSTIDLSAYAGMPSVQVRWYYNSLGFYWAIDDIVIKGEYTPQYAWTATPAGNGLPGAAATPSASNNTVSITPSAVGPYNYTAKTYLNGCASTGTTVTATVVDIPPVNITPTASTAACGSGVVTLTATIPSGYALALSPFTDLYTDLAATTPYAGSGSGPFYAKPSTNISYTASQTGTCGTSSATIPFTVTGSPTALSATGINTDIYSQTGIVTIRDQNCDLIATVQSSGSNPVGGLVTAQVNNMGSVGTTGSGQPFVGRVYDLEPAVDPNTSTGHITLYFTQAEFDAYNASLTPAQIAAGYNLLPANASDPNQANIAITQFHGTGGFAPYTGNLITPFVTFDPSHNWWEVEFSVDSFSTFFASAGFPGGGALPVNLQSISATNEGSRNRIDWTSTEEKNLNRYELQHAPDGKTFEKIETVNAQGKAFGYIAYDRKPNSGVNYYRLKMIDNDGTFAYSKTVTTTMRGNNSGFTVTTYPNPAANSLTIEVYGGATTGGQVALSDAAGLSIGSYQLEPTRGYITIDLTNVAAGIYFVKYSDGTHTETVKVTKL